LSETCRVCDRPATRVVGGRPVCDEHLERATRRLGSLWRVDLATIAVVVVFVVAVYALDELLEPRLTGLPLLALSLVLALVPALVWLGFFYRRDRREPEPRRMVLGVFVLGALVAGAIVIPLLRDVIGVDDWRPGSPLLSLAIAILVVGMIEEVAKYATLRLSVYDSAEFDERVDGVIYGTAVGLGIATALNVAFVTGSGGTDLGSGAIRIVVTTLAHASFGGIVGYFLARQKLDGRPIWWMPAGVALAALCDGTFVFLRGQVAAGIGSGGIEVGPWLGLGLAALLAGGITVGLAALIDRELRPATAPSA
jgi:RsiW-degrading membrane proteinase PrsW (M82 family)